MRVKVSAKYANREGTMTCRDQILAIVSKHIPTGSKTINENIKLWDMGLTSLDVVEIIFDIEEAFQIQVPYISPGQRVRPETNGGQDMKEFETVHDIVTAVERILAGSKWVARPAQ
jgi:acyl carrier protein